MFVITIPADHIQKAKENTKTQNKALKLKAPPLEGFLGKIGIPRDLGFALLSYSPCQGQGSSTRKRFSVQPHQQGGSGESCTGVRSLRFLAWICKKCNYHSQQESFRKSKCGAAKSCWRRVGTGLVCLQVCLSLERVPRSPKSSRDKVGD